MTALITSKVTMDGTAMPRDETGGVAYFDKFGTYYFHTYYSPALVYFNSYGTQEHNLAACISHEWGRFMRGVM